MASNKDGDIIRVGKNKLVIPEGMKRDHNTISEIEVHPREARLIIHRLDEIYGSKWFNWEGWPTNEYGSPIQTIPKGIRVWLSDFEINEIVKKAYPNVFRAPDDLDYKEPFQPGGKRKYQHKYYEGRAKFPTDRLHYRPDYS